VVPTWRRDTIRRSGRRYGRMRRAGSFARTRKPFLSGTCPPSAFACAGSGRHSKGSHRLPGARPSTSVQWYRRRSTNQPRSGRLCLPLRIRCGPSDVANHCTAVASPCGRQSLPGRAVVAGPPPPTCTTVRAVQATPEAAVRRGDDGFLSRTTSGGSSRGKVGLPSVAMCPTSGGPTSRGEDESCQGGSAVSRSTSNAGPFHRVQPAVLSIQSMSGMTTESSTPASLISARRGAYASARYAQHRS
jgi:hypothetical protein